MKRFWLLCALAVLPLVVQEVGAASDLKFVIRMKGTVQSSVDDRATWQPVYAQRALKERDSARTLADSKARIQTPDGSVAIMAPNTTATMSEFTEANMLRIRVDSGGVRAKVSKAFSQGHFELDTKNGVLAARGTEFCVTYEAPPVTPSGAGLGLLAQTSNVYCFVFEGIVSVDNGKTQLLLSPGDVLVLGSDGSYQLNPPGLNPGYLPPELRPDPPLIPPLVTSTYTDESGRGVLGPSGTTGPAFYTQQGSQLIPLYGDQSLSRNLGTSSNPSTGSLELHLNFGPPRP